MPYDWFTKYFIGMFERYFLTKSFYFSSDYDLTNPFSVSALREFRGRYYDDRFYYNAAFTKKLVELGLDNWIQPFICGLVEFKSMQINQKAVIFILISRRDKLRAGVRFISRGADAQGNVTNFAETEQILIFENAENYDVYTYLQTRGSIPIIWKQSPNLKWSPTLMIDKNPLKTKNAFKLHMDKIKKQYQFNHIINLIDKKGSQKLIGESFTELIKEEKDFTVDYTWFDFHAECKNMQWNNLSKLIDLLQASIQKYKYGHFKVEKPVDDMLS